MPCDTAGAPTRPPTRHARQRPSTQSANPADEVLTAPAEALAAESAAAAAAPPLQPSAEQEPAAVEEAPAAAAATDSPPAAELNQKDAALPDVATAPSEVQASADAQVIDLPMGKDKGADVVKDTMMNEDQIPQAAVKELQPQVEAQAQEALAPAAEQPALLQAPSDAVAATAAVSAPAAEQDAADNEVELPDAATAAAGVPTWQGPTVRLSQAHEAAGSGPLQEEDHFEPEPLP